MDLSMDELTVTAYNVLFGDALLLAIPERFKGKKVTRHIMIDLGNSLLPKSGREDLFLDVAKDVRRRLDGRPIDLYVMTHEHLDHVKGLKFLDSQGIKLEIDQVWLTASARPGYYSRFLTTIFSMASMALLSSLAPATWQNRLSPS